MPKVQLPQNIAKLKEQLETGNNLIDYFLVCGIPPSTCRQDFLYTDNYDQYEEIFKENAKPIIISRFPEFDNAIDGIDEEIINYCFPDGFNPIISGTSKKPEDKLFTIILDNNLFCAEHPQKYLTCLLFYESLTQYENLKEEFEKYNNPEYEKQKRFREIFGLTHKKTHTSTYVLPSSIEQNKLEIPNSSQRDTEKSTYILPSSIDKFQNQNDTNLKKTVSSVSNSTINKNPIKRASFLSDQVNIYIPKVVCLVSIYPYIKLHQEILHKIVSYKSHPTGIPLEKLITNLIIEVPVAPRGLYSIHYNLLGKQYVFQNSENNKIQITTANLKGFNSIMSFQTILEALKHILLTNKILIFSTDVNLITDTILGFLVLLFPFKYPFQVTSHLPKDSFNLLEAFTPYIFGIKEKYEKTFFEENEIEIDNASIFIIDLERKESHLMSAEEFPKFPAKISSNLEKNIKNLDNKFKNYKEEDLMAYNEQYQNHFFTFFCELLKGYEENLNMNYFKSSEEDRVTSIKTLFQCEKFIRSHGNASEQKFYSSFVEDSQLFADFISKRMIPKNNQEILDVLMVNETNIKIKNKQKYFGSKEAVSFIDSKDYAPVNKYVVPVPRTISKEENEEINSKKRELLDYGQIITTTKNNLSSISYILFPQLNFSIYLNNENANEYFPPQDYSEEIEAINTELLSKTSIGKNIDLGLQMKNNIYLAWLEVWAYSFWYQEKDERKYYFNVMLDVLNLLVHHEMKILNLLFDVLNQENEQTMIKKLYQKILELKINPSMFIYNIISNRLEKEQIQELFNEIKTDTKKDLYFEDSKALNPNKNPRTFESKYDKNSLISNKLYFESIYYCIDCNADIHLYSVCRKFERIKNDVLWVPCPNNHYNLPKIKVKFGTELFPLSILDNQLMSTSTTDEIVLHSPYDLKVNIKDAVTGQYGTKMDVNEFKFKFSPLFWNFIWYCQIHKLKYDIILPYEKKLIQAKNKKAIVNPNIDSIKLLVDNTFFNANCAKLNKNSSYDSKKSNVPNMFKNLGIVSGSSFNIQKAIKIKGKKYVSIFIDHSLLPSTAVYMSGSGNNQK